MAQFIDGFYRELHGRLSKTLTDRINALAGGSAKMSETGTSTVAENYAAAVSYIRAVRDVLAICRQVEGDIHGNKPNEDDDDE